MIVAIPGAQSWFNIQKSVLKFTVNRIKQNHDNLRRCKKSIWQNLTPIYDKNSQQIRKGHFPNLIRSIYKKPTANVIPDDDILSALNLSIQHFTRSLILCSKTKNNNNKDL